MDLESEILKEHSKRNTVRLARWVGNDPVRFMELMRLFLRGEYRVTQRSAWIVRHCAEKYPGLSEPYLPAMIDRMIEPGVHAAVKRNVIRILQDIEIPRKLQGKVATLCFDFLESNAPIAVKCFSLTVLLSISKHEPDLKNELRLIIEKRVSWESAGFKSRGARVLSQLNR